MKIECRWTNTHGTKMLLVAPLWWLAVVGESELHEGQWYWKVVLKQGLESGVEDTQEECIRMVESLITTDEFYDYSLYETFEEHSAS